MIPTRRLGLHRWRCKLLSGICVALDDRVLDLEGSGIHKGALASLTTFPLFVKTVGNRQG